MEPTMTRARRHPTGTPLTLTADEVNAIPLQAVTDCPGVRVRELWEAGDFVQALLFLEPGARTPGPPHPGACHHIWVVSGEASVAGKLLRAGSYVYVPPGVAHPIVAHGPQGCALLQVHRVTGPAVPPA
jgi:quercetin dioxygenase-like cupin family protein